jgi:PPOX class probable F420-dependent enzyme
VTPEEREGFIAEPRVAVFSTVDPRGRVHAVPVWFLWRDGAFRIITDRGSQKHKNAERTGRASLAIVEGPKYVTAEGPVTVHDPISLDDRLELHIHYRGEDAARTIVANNRHEHMVILELKPEQWLG